jgi:hypothetical protein
MAVIYAERRLFNSGRQPSMQKKTVSSSRQGDQIGRTFANWAIVFFGHLLLQK